MKQLLIAILLLSPIIIGYIQPIPKPLTALFMGYIYVTGLTLAGWLIYLFVSLVKAVISGIKRTGRKN